MDQEEKSRDQQNLSKHARKPCKNQKSEQSRLLKQNPIEIETKSRLLKPQEKPRGGGSYIGAVLRRKFYQEKNRELFYGSSTLLFLLLKKKVFPTKNSLSLL